MFHTGRMMDCCDRCRPGSDRGRLSANRRAKAAASQAAAPKRPRIRGESEAADEQAGGRRAAHLGTAGRAKPRPQAPPPPIIPKVALSDASHTLSGQRRRHDARGRTRRSCRKAASLDSLYGLETVCRLLMDHGSTHRSRRVAATESGETWRMTRLTVLGRRQGGAGGSAIDWGIRAEHVKQHVAEAGATFPVLLDRQGQLLRQDGHGQADAADLSCSTPKEKVLCSSTSSILVPPDEELVQGIRAALERP